jgi:class 3 adenylate cyclase
VAKLTARERVNLPERAFAYVGPDGRRRLPIHDEAHVRNALARFDRVAFEDDAARDRARRRLLQAAKRFGIVPVGFMDGQVRSERTVRSPDVTSLPTGTVTFLLTDIEASTVLLRRLRADYAPVLRDVRGLIGSSVRKAGGRKVDAHGDEFLAVFARPGPALTAAVEIQRALLERSWPRRLDVRLRAGIHVGRPTLTEAGYVGLSVHTVARVCSVGHGGQIVVSAQAKTAASRTMPSGMRLRTLGSHRLAGLPRPTALFQLEAEGLATEFPPLRIAFSTSR